MKGALRVVTAVVATVCCWSVVATGAGGAGADAPGKPEAVAGAGTSDKAAVSGAAKSAEKSSAREEAGQAPTLESVLTLIDQRLKDVKDMSADVRGTRQGMRAGDGPSSLSGTLKCLSPDYMWMELTVRGKGEDGKETVRGSAKMVRNGNMQYEESSGALVGGAIRVRKMDLVEMAKVRKEAADSGVPIGKPGLPDYMNYLKWQKEAGLEIRVVNVEKELATFEVQAKGVQDAGGYKEEVVISTGDGLLRSVKSMYKGQVVLAMELSNIKTNTGLKAADFAYGPPEGAQVQDDVQALRASLKARQGPPRPAPPSGGEK